MRTDFEKQTFTQTDRISETLSSEHAKHERPDSLRQMLTDPEKPLELPRGTVVVEVGPSALKESSYNTISKAIDSTPVSAFDNEKGYLELSGTVLEDPNVHEGKIALIYDSSVSPDEGKARIPAAVLIFEPLTVEQITDLRAKLPEGVPLLDAKTNKIIDSEATSDAAGSSSNSEYESMGGSFGGGGVSSSEMPTVYIDPEKPQEGETPEEFEERRTRQRQEEEEARIEREVREEERERQEAAESIVRDEEIRKQVAEQWEAKKRTGEERNADIERRANEIRDARKAAEEAIEQTPPANTEQSPENKQSA